MKGQGKLTAKGAKIVAALERFRDTLESGVPIEQRYTVRKIRLKLTPRTFEPKEVKNVRAALGISQPVFSQFLGVDVKTVRSWEQGQRVPSLGVRYGVPGTTQGCGKPTGRATGPRPSTNPQAGCGHGGRTSG